MIKIYPAESRYSANHGWLQSNFSFSFAEYYDPNNIHFSALRVLNDDIIQPTKGFGTHPHQEMEIVSIVLKGFLQHKDSIGNVATTTFGEIQRMSAGTGIYHSEFNASDTEEVHLLQLWFLPETQGLTPSYEKTSFDVQKMNNQLLPVVTKNPSNENIAAIHQELTIYLADLEKEQSISHTNKNGKNIFIFVIDGEILLNKGGTQQE